jgi:hypothetical protein
MPKDIHGEDWDTGDGSAPDVFVDLTCPPSSAPNVTQTPYVESYNPEWTSDGCTATAEALTKEPLQVYVFDYDPFTPSNDLVTGFSIQLTSALLSDQKELLIPPPQEAPLQALKSLTLRVSFVGN